MTMQPAGSDAACALNHLFVAHWREELSLAELEPRRKGKAKSKGWVQSMGFNREGKHLYEGVIEVVSPVEVKVRSKSGGGLESIELAKLREGEMTIFRP